MKARTMFMSLTGTQALPAGEIPGVLDQGQGRSGACASKVTVGWTKRVKPDATASAPMQQDEAGQAPRGVRGGHERTGTDDPTRELKFNTFRAETIERE